MGSCLGVGHNYARVGNSYEFDIETLQNSIDIKTKTLETTVKHLETKYNSALNKLIDDKRDIHDNIRIMENNFDIRITSLETEIRNVNVGIEENKTKAISMKRKFRDLGNLINNMSSSENSVDSIVLESGKLQTQLELGSENGNSEATEYTETEPIRPDAPFQVSQNSAFNEFKNENEI